MSKLLVIVATLKAILIAASIAFARGEILPVILISVLFNLAQVGAKPIGQPRDTILVSPSDDRDR
jgi:Na+/H+-dicarboxylate symporter